MTVYPKIPDFSFLSYLYLSVYLTSSFVSLFFSFLVFAGVSGEACSLAGHLGLSRLIVLYDDNEITIDGKIDLSFSENVQQRFKAYNWHVDVVQDGNHDVRGIVEVSHHIYFSNFLFFFGETSSLSSFLPLSFFCSMRVARQALRGAPCHRPPSFPL